ncbi:MAG TPA: TonB-dependent receptor [Burkholderiales bacterium]|nr:TonB-dependent receptor [Burkholderiales bacterium]
MRSPSALALLFLLLCSQAGGAGLPGREGIVVTPDQEGLAGQADAASQGTVEQEQLENRPLLRPAEVLEVIPGVVVTQHSGSGKANQYFLRGFNLDHGTDFAVHVDGMPVNLPSHGHGQGYADLNFLIPELVEHIHYRKGPYYADEGDFSAAGAAHVHLKRSLRSDFAEATAGSYGYRRALFGAARDVEGGKLLGALELNHENGPWQTPEQLRKLNAVLRYAHGDDENGLSVTGMAYANRWNATDQVPLRAVQSGQLDRFGAVDPSDGGRSSRYSLSAQWARSTQAGSATRASAYLIRSDLDLFSNFTYFLNDPVNGDQIEQVDRRTVSGAELSHSWRSSAAGRDFEHTLGVQMRNDNIPEVGLHNTVARQRIGTVRSDSVLQTSASAYYSNSVAWTPWLRSLLGLRADQYRFRVASDNPANSGTASAGLASPKLGLVLGPWSDVEYFANYGYGFHSNDARGTTITVDPATGAAASRVTPLVRAKGGELGVRAAPFKGVQTSLSLWRLDIESELLFTGDAGTTEPSRPSRRQGVEWANYLKLPRGMVADFDVTLSRARFKDDDPAGSFIPGSPDRTLSAGLTYEEGPWSGGLRLRYFGPRPLIESNAERSGASTLLNAKIAYAPSRQVKLRLDMLNLLNRRVDDITYFYTSRLPGEPAAGIADQHFHPAEPRTLRLSVALSL